MGGRHCNVVSLGTSISKHCTKRVKRGGGGGGGGDVLSHSQLVFIALPYILRSSIKIHSLKPLRIDPIDTWS